MFKPAQLSRFFCVHNMPRVPTSPGVKHAPEFETAPGYQTATRPQHAPGHQYTLDSQHAQRPQHTLGLKTSPGFKTAPGRVLALKICLKIRLKPNIKRIVIHKFAEELFSHHVDFQKVPFPSLRQNDKTVGISAILFKQGGVAKQLFCVNK